MTAKQFILGLPAKVNPVALEGQQSIFHFEISGEEGGDFTVEVKDGDLKVYETLQGDPACVVQVKDQNLISIVSGKLNPMMAMMTGKIKVSNTGEMIKFAKIFGFM
jgi:putative sterol carrier protein